MKIARSMRAVAAVGAVGLLATACGGSLDSGVWARFPSVSSRSVSTGTQMDQFC